MHLERDDILAVQKEKVNLMMANYELHSRHTNIKLYERFIYPRVATCQANYEKNCRLLIALVAHFEAFNYFKIEAFRKRFQGIGIEVVPGVKKLLLCIGAIKTVDSEGRKTDNSN